MKQDAQLHFRLTHELLIAAHRTAYRRNETLSAVLRRYLEAYTASRPLKAE